MWRSTENGLACPVFIFPTISLSSPTPTPPIAATHSDRTGVWFWGVPSHLPLLFILPYPIQSYTRYGSLCLPVLPASDGLWVRYTNNLPYKCSVNSKNLKDVRISQKILHTNVHKLFWVEIRDSNNSDRIHSCSSFQSPVTAYDADLHAPAYTETLSALRASGQLLYILHGASQYFSWIKFIDSIVAFFEMLFTDFRVIATCIWEELPPLPARNPNTAHPHQTN